MSNPARALPDDYPVEETLDDDPYQPTRGPLEVASPEPVTAGSRRRFGGNGPLGQVFRSAGAKMMVLPLSAILGIINTRLIIQYFGKPAFAQYGLLIGMANLIPFADLGITASIINAIAKSDDPAHDPYVRRVLTTGIRMVSASCLVLIAVAVGLTVTHSWHALLGDGLLANSGDLAAGLCLTVFAITLLVGYGQQVLTGLGMNHFSILLTAFQTPAVLVFVGAGIVTHAHLGPYVAVAGYGANFLVSAAALLIANRKISPNLGQAMRDVPRLHVKGAPVFNLAWPMLLQMIALPIAMQSDRLVLSHLSSPGVLAQYNLASQMFTPVWSVVSSAGMALWPIFARARATDASTAPSPMKLSVGFAGGAAFTCLCLGLISGWLADKASDGQISLSLALVVVFSLFMTAQGAKFPLGMFMTNAAGLRFQALWIALGLLPVNLALSIVSAERWGAVGPVLGSAISVFLCQVLPNLWFVRRELRRQLSGEVVASADAAS